MTQIPKWDDEGHNESFSNSPMDDLSSARDRPGAEVSKNGGVVTMPGPKNRIVIEILLS